MTEKVLYLCRKCERELPPPVPYAMTIHCSHCMRLTAASVAKALGDYKLNAEAAEEQKVDHLQQKTRSLGKQVDLASTQLNEQKQEVEPVALPERRTLNAHGLTALDSEAEGWNECLDEIAKLGPLYTRPAPIQHGGPVGEVVGRRMEKCRFAPLVMWADDVHNGRTPPGTKLYTHADPAEVETLRAHLAELKEAFNESQEELVARGKKLAELTAEKERLRESNGEMDQRLSENGFHMKRLFTRLVEKLGLNPDSDTWFDIADKVELTFDALTAMHEAFDISQQATADSAIGLTRVALGKPQIKPGPLR